MKIENEIAWLVNGVVFFVYFNGRS